MKIRQARSEDIEDIKRIDEISLTANHSIEYFKRYLSNIIVAVENEELIGYFMFRNQIAMNMAIHPNYRKKGIGKLLFREATKRSKRFISRTRENNLTAIEFLKRLGFIYKRKINNYYKNGDTAIEMEWIKT